MQGRNSPSALDVVIIDAGGQITPERPAVVADLVAVLTLWNAATGLTEASFQELKEQVADTGS